MRLFPPRVPHSLPHSLPPSLTLSSSRTSSSAFSPLLLSPALLGTAAAGLQRCCSLAPSPPPPPPQHSPRSCNSIAVLKQERRTAEAVLSRLAGTEELKPPPVIRERLNGRMSRTADSGSCWENVFIHSVQTAGQKAGGERRQSDPALMAVRPALT